MRFKWTDRGFTLIELLVVIAMIAIIMAAMTVSVAGAQERARIQKATAEVKAVTQAVLAAENFDDSFLDKFGSPQDLDANNLKFLLGEGKDESGAKMPAFLLASLSADSSLKDPWGTTYKITIRRGSISGARFSEVKTGLTIPNLWALSESERVIYEPRKGSSGGGK